MEINLAIVEADDFDVTAFQKSCPFLVIFLFFLSVVLAAIQFYNQANYGAVEVTDVVPYNFLPVEAERMFAEVQVPELSFLLCHVLSEFFCSFQRRAVFRHCGLLVHGSLEEKNGKFIMRNGKK